MWVIYLVQCDGVWWFCYGILYINRVEWGFSVVLVDANYVECLLFETDYKDE